MPWLVKEATNRSLNFVELSSQNWNITSYSKTTSGSAAVLTWPPQTNILLSSLCNGTTSRRQVEVWVPFPPSYTFKEESWKPRIIAERHLPKEDLGARLQLAFLFASNFATRFVPHSLLAIHLWRLSYVQYFGYFGFLYYNIFLTLLTNLLLFINLSHLIPLSARSSAEVDKFVIISGLWILKIVYVAVIVTIVTLSWLHIIKTKIGFLLLYLLTYFF